jgi:TorA maturation chaperone TorD
MIAEAAWATTRSQLYRVLATAFLQPPTPGLVGPFLDAGVLDDLAARFGEAAVAELRAFRETFRGDSGDLDQDYQDLFVVPLGRYVTPYEAVYRDERVVDGQVVRGLLMGPSTLAIRALYRAAGVEVAADLLELPDHVGLELACMAELCEAEARARDGGEAESVACARALQRRLLEDHLLQWVPSLCTRVHASARGAFYRGLAALTEAFLREEAMGLVAPDG